MTPLAMKIGRDLLKPLRLRRQNGGVMAAREIIESAQFDVTDVFEEACALQEKFIIDGEPERLSFLPSKKTWIEWADKHGRRTGVLLKQTNYGGIAERFVWPDARRYYFGKQENKFQSPQRFIPLSKIENATFAERERFIRELSADFPIPAFLAMINTPRIIGRRIHMPHAGFQRDLARQKGLVGKFPLQAWTEIKLEVTPPRDESGKPVHDTILTGERALHFVRAHLRVRNGMLIYVSAHWRGNAAMGIKRTRYSVVPPKNGIWPKTIAPSAGGAL